MYLKPGFPCQRRFLLWFGNVLGQIFGDFDMAEILVALPQKSTKGTEGQAEPEMVETDGSFKQRDAVEVIRVVPGKITARINRKGIAVSGFFRFLHDHVIILPFRKGNEFTRLSRRLFNGGFRCLQLIPCALAVKAGQGL